MEDKLVTLAILTYAKAQILKSVLEDHGIKTYIHNVNQIQPIISSGVRLRIEENDLPQALKVTESSAWLSQDIIQEKPVMQDKSKKKKVLVPVDFSDYSMQACHFGFDYARAYDAEVVLLHVYFTPFYDTALPYGDIFNYRVSDNFDEKKAISKIHNDLNDLSNKVKEKVASGIFPNVHFSCVLREGVPEEEILKAAKEINPEVIIMGTRGKHKKDVDLIGSVTAEVLERTRFNTLVIPENTPFTTFNEVNHFAFITNFNQRDLITFDSFMKALSPFKYDVSLIHLAEHTDKWNEIKLAGIKEYFKKQYPNLTIKYDIVENDDLLVHLDEYIQDNQIDILAHPTYKRNVFSRLFNPSIAKKMIFHSDTPLFVIAG